MSEGPSEEQPPVSRRGGSVQDSNVQGDETSSRTSNLICEVCSDSAKCLHFGGLSCESCKAFFRRSVQNNATFTCSGGGGDNGVRCEINVTTRKSCQYCRYQKCLDIGMESRWVMSEQERLAVRQRRARQTGDPAEPELKSLSRHSPSLPEESTQQQQRREDNPNEELTTEDRTEIIILLRKYFESYRHFPYVVPNHHPPNQTKDSMAILNLFDTMLRRLVYFYRSQSEFLNLPVADQSSLLRASALEICMLRSSIFYDANSSVWSSPQLENSSSNHSQTATSASSSSSTSQSNDPDSPIPILQMNDVRKLVSLDLFEMHLRFITEVQRLKADESIVTLLTHIVLFCPDRPGVTLEATDEVSRLQDKYLELLKNYVNWRFGSVEGKRMYAKYLGKLADLRQLNDCQSEFNLQLEQNEVLQIRSLLSNI